MPSRPAPDGGDNQKRYLAGALNPWTRRLTWMEGTSKSSALLIQLLWRLAGEYRRARRIHLIDLTARNAQRHASPCLRRSDLRRAA